MTMDTNNEPTLSLGDAIRLDKWLWAARWFRTRSLASQACVAGHVKVNGQTAKAAKLIRCGDALQIRLPQGSRQLTVLGLAEKRGPASEAKQLYEDTTPQVEQSQPPLGVFRPRGLGRPSKRDLRKIRELRGY